METTPDIEVGIILMQPQIHFAVFGRYADANGVAIGGGILHVASLSGNKIAWNGQLHDELLFTPQDETAYFELKDVTIGVQFHWQRKEVQRFRGKLKIMVEEGQLTAVNLISIEDYLQSVISSEMSATASLEFLKAHAVISRSWAMNIIRKAEARKAGITADEQAQSATPQCGDAYIRWYNSESHKFYHVCADDHCQRYQGTLRTTTSTAVEAVKATRGEVLTYGDEICDARYSKCCGGAMELFSTGWEDRDYPYLNAGLDTAANRALPNLTNEKEAERWIRSAPEAFCNTHDQQVLSQVLNNYDQETTQFYRWQVRYTQEQLSDLILRKLGVDFGQIIDLIPIERGTSGRLKRLQIKGTMCNLIIGKELEIRRTLSESHLYSSAFVVDKTFGSDKRIPAAFTLTGAGWGHGVGLCQIGAAVMGAQGYNYKDILRHYYQGAVIKALYE